MYHVIIHFFKCIINNKWATSLTYTSRNQIRPHKAVNTTLCICIKHLIYTTVSFVYMILHVRIDFLTLPYRLLIFSNLPYDVTPYGSNDVYLTVSGLLFPCTTQYNILFYSNIFLYLLVRMFVLYLLHGCLIPTHSCGPIMPSGFGGKTFTDSSY